MKQSPRVAAAAAVVALAASACGASQSPSVAPAVAAVCTQKAIKIAVPVSPPNVVHIPPYVAKDLGYFKEENLDVELPRFEGGVGAFRSMASGAVQLAGTSSEPAISAIAQGGGVKVVYTYAPNVDVSFVVGQSIQRGSDLKGKKIGIQEPTGFADVMSRVALKKAGVKPEEVTFVQTTTAARVQWLLTGQVDTGVLHIDQTLAAQKRNPGIHVLYNMWDILTDYQYSVFAASDQLIKSDPATVECMVRALMKADRALYDPGKRQQMIDIATKYTQQDRPIVEQTFDTLVKAKAWPQNDGVLRRNIEGTVKSLKDNGQLTRDVTYDQVVDLSFAQKVVQQLGKKDFPY